MAAAKGSKDEKKRPIIVKKIKKVAGGHHGGAWKVSYADFVTAMMAFFLLLWLLSSASKETLTGLSDYFTPTTGITSNVGIKDAPSGESSSPSGHKKSDLSDRAIVAGNPIAGTVSENPEHPAQEESTQDDNLFKQGASAVEQAFSSDPAVKQYLDNVSVEQTSEGLRITIADSDKYAMFEKSSAQLTVHGQAVLSKMAQLVKKMPNFMAIYGSTDASPAETGNANYTNWELSADRAQSARRFLTHAGVEQERTKKVAGLADKELYVPSEPRSPKNRRISLVMLRGSHILIPDSAVPSHAESAPMPVATPVIPNVPPPASSEQ
jgi:chemotaxis protein MotB